MRRQNSNRVQPVSDRLEDIDFNIPLEDDLRNSYRDSLPIRRFSGERAPWAFEDEFDVAAIMRNFIGNYAREGSFLNPVQNFQTVPIEDKKIFFSPDPRSSQAQNDCVICTDTMVEQHVIRLPCNDRHIFHPECIE